MAEKEYIDREAVNALIEAECSPKVAAFLNHAIDNIPAADVRPVVRGRWSKELGKVETEGGSVTLVYPQCSECGFIATWGSTYCPHCGADMEES